MSKYTYKKYKLIQCVFVIVVAVAIVCIVSLDAYITWAVIKI